MTSQIFKNIEWPRVTQLEDLEPLSDEEILAKLDSFGIAIQRAEFEQQCRSAFIVDDILEHIKTKFAIEEDFWDEYIDWVLVALMVLWERWCPDISSFHRLDHKLGSAWDASAARDDEKACMLFRDAWSETLSMLERTESRTLDELAKKFNGLYGLHGLLDGFTLSLRNMSSKNPSEHEENISLCERAIELLDKSEDNLPLIADLQETVAASHLQLGNEEKADSIYKQLVNERKDELWPWLGWSRSYQWAGNLQRSEEILKEASAQGFENNTALLRTLADVLEKRGRSTEAEALRQKMHSIEASEQKAKTQNYSKANAALPGRTGAAPTATVGRKEPCPCGSGKKFKRCCGANRL